MNILPPYAFEYPSRCYELYEMKHLVKCSLWSIEGRYRTNMTQVTIAQNNVPKMGQLGPKNVSRTLK